MTNRIRARVALFTSAWIETKHIQTLQTRKKSHSSRVRGLKLSPAYKKQRKNLSHSSRVRGLKQTGTSSWIPINVLALFTSAWIETSLRFSMRRRTLRRTLHECVD